MIKIITDSSADIPIKQAEELGIVVVPIKVQIDEVSYVDGTLPSHELYSLLCTAENVPSTSQPSPQDFIEAFRLAAKQGYNEIISIHISSLLSGTYQSAVMAKKMLEEENIKITVVDSKGASYVLGMIVVAAARAVKEGRSILECLDVIKFYKKNTNVFFLVDTLDYLLKGGRIGRASAMIGTLLNIIPILSINQQGEIYSIDKIRGKNKAFQKILELAQEAIPLSTSVTMAVIHADNQKGAEKWLRDFSALYDIKESIIAPLGPALGIHTGPGLIACVIAPFKKVCEIVNKNPKEGFLK